MTERRRDERLPARELGLPVGLQSLVPGREPLHGELVNVSAGGMAVWLPKVLDPGSHWLLTSPDAAGAAVPAKVVATKPAFGGHVHSFKFASPQAKLADKLAKGKWPRT